MAAAALAKGGTLCNESPVFMGMIGIRHRVHNARLRGTLGVCVCVCTDGESEEAGERFVKTMGFTKAQLDRTGSTAILIQVFVFVSDTIKNGTAVRVGDTALILHVINI